MSANHLANSATREVSHAGDIKKTSNGGPLRRLRLRTNLHRQRGQGEVSGPPFTMEIDDNDIDPLDPIPTKPADSPAPVASLSLSYSTQGAETEDAQMEDTFFSAA